MIWEECKLQYKQPECGISDCSECEYRKLYNKYKHLKESIGNYKVYSNISSIQIERSFTSTNTASKSV